MVSYERASTKKSRASTENQLANYITKAVTLLKCNFAGHHAMKSVTNRSPIVSITLNVKLLWQQIQMLILLKTLLGLSNFDIDFLLLSYDQVVEMY